VVASVVVSPVVVVPGAGPVLVLVLVLVPGAPVVTVVVVSLALSLMLPALDDPELVTVAPVPGPLLASVDVCGVVVEPPVLSLVLSPPPQATSVSTSIWAGRCMGTSLWTSTLPHPRGIGPVGRRRDCRPDPVPLRHGPHIGDMFVCAVSRSTSACSAAICSCCSCSVAIARLA
jgi:hypothetical protein